MNAHLNSHRCLITLICFMIGSLVDSSSPPSAIGCGVGEKVVLPCSWKLRLGEVNLPDCHVQWKNPAKTVFERLGERKFVGSGFDGRLELLEENLESGDCSLTISDVQKADMGRYESFMLVNGVRSTKKQVFIQSVRLSVTAHWSNESKAEGEDLVLELHTHHSERVIFQLRGSSEWLDLWKRGDKDRPNLEHHPLPKQLTIKNLGSSNEGTYQVLDNHGLTVSTVRLSVRERPESSTHDHNREDQVPTGGAVKERVSAFLLMSVFVLIFQILVLW